MRQRTLPDILFAVLFAVIPALFLVFSQEETCCAQNAAGEYGNEQLTAEVLQKSLYAKTPEEEAYCAFVVAQRDKKVLPDRVLYSAYRYAVSKDKDRRFSYFKYSLEKLYKNAGVVLKQEPEVKKTATPLSIFRFSNSSGKIFSKSALPASGRAK
ncbi:hypothetical protein FACS189427_02820 [Planctomycetales bacterium]|nr:hypothetical protein FACS189427_02820 [Planctomycetales bacterium]